MLRELSLIDGIGLQVVNSIPVWSFVNVLIGRVLTSVMSCLDLEKLTLRRTAAA